MLSLEQSIYLLIYRSNYLTCVLLFVQIEPELQTQILDLTMETEGVLFAGVPGAGGFDAVFAVILGDANHNPIISTWSSRGVLPLLVGEDPLGVRLETGDPRARDVSSAISSITIS